MRKREIDRSNWWDPETMPGYERLGASARAREGDWPIWLTLAAGAGLFGYGVVRRDRAGLASAVAGSALLYRGTQMASGNDVGELVNPKMDVHRTVTIARPANELYEFWRPANMTKFMPHLLSVEDLGNHRQRWVMEGPLKRKIEWEAEIISNIANRLISWQTLPGAIVEEWGSVEFTPVRGGRETEVTLSMSYRLPGGVLGAGVAAWTGIEPAQVTREALRRFKQLMETGEIATTASQPAGKRGVLGKGMEKLLGERSRQMPEHTFGRARAR